jgi:NAD(P)-dependent dehydrogenase (short-subunit alcohol dehydrogenase family)
MLLRDKVVIVTGAGGGLGAGIARVCAREGAKVVVADIRGDAAMEVAARLDGARGVACDLRDDAALESLVADTVEAFGRIDGLVNNAGANFAKPFLDTTAQDWEWVLSLDLRAVFFLTQKVCRQMLSQGDGGSVVNISSVHSQSCLPGAGPYDAAKWGVVGMGKSMAAGAAGDPCQRHLTGSAQHTDLAGSAERRAEPRGLSRLLEAEHPHRPCHRAGGDRRTGGVSAV